MHEWMHEWCAWCRPAPSPGAKTDHTAVVTAGGVDSGRLQQRRQAASSSVSHSGAGGSGMGVDNPSSHGHLEDAAEDEAYDEEDEDEDWKKDA